MSAAGCSATELDSSAFDPDANRGLVGPAGPVGPQGPSGTSVDAADGGTAPSHAPGSLTFVDTDLNANSIEGTIKLTRATDESDVSSYAVYYGKSATEKLYLSPIFVAPAPGTGDIEFSLNVAPPPADATYLLAFSQNAHGEMATGVATKFHDVAPVAVDITGGSSFGSYSSVFADTVSGKLLVIATRGYDDAPILIRCNYDGSACTYTDIAGSNTVSIDSAAIAMDSGHLYVAIATSVRELPLLIRCSLDGSSCGDPVDISAGQAEQSALAPQIAIDSVNAKLLVIANEITSGEKPGLFYCDLDGSACVYRDLSAGLVTTERPSFVIDEGTQKIDVGFGSASDAYTACGIDGTSCVAAGAVPAYGMLTTLYFSRVIAGPSPNTLAFAWTTSADTATMSFCDSDFGACSYYDISGGRPSGSGSGPWPAFDPVSDQLYVAMMDNADGDKVHVNRCNNDGSDCRSFPMSSSISNPGDVSLALVPNAGHFVAFTSGSIYFPQ